MTGIVAKPERVIARSDRRLTDLQIVLQHIGWEIRDLDLDVVSGSARLELHRGDGRWLLLHADHIGRVSITRQHRTITLGIRDNQHGCIARSPQIRDEFLGRTKHEGPRAAMRSLCNYLADNPQPGRPQIAPSVVRNAFAPLMREPLRLGSSR